MGVRVKQGRASEGASIPAAAMTNSVAVQGCCPLANTTRRVAGPARSAHVARRRRAQFVRAAAGGGASSIEMMAVEVPQPLGAVDAQLDVVSRGGLSLPAESLARQVFDTRCEQAVNEQINVEYNVSYAYHALYAYFSRDNVALPGLAAYFKAASVEEREHAEKLMDYQALRGGKVVLQSIMLPQLDFNHPEKGDALYAMELTLALEKLTNEKLLQLHAVADECGDASMCDFVEGEFLAEQVEAVNEVSRKVAQLRRVGLGHGVWAWDRELLEAAGEA